MNINVKISLHMNMVYILFAYLYYKYLKINEGIESLQTKLINNQYSK